MLVDLRKKLFENFKQRLSKLKKGHSQDLVKQTVVLLHLLASTRLLTLHLHCSLSDGGGWSKMEVSFSVSTQSILKQLSRNCIDLTFLSIHLATLMIEYFKS